MFNLPEPTAREARPAWNAVPPDVVSRLENLLGKISHGENVWGGYSPSACFKLTTAHGKFFVKGTHPDQDSHGAAQLRQEIEAYEDIPVLKKISPAYIGTITDGDEDGWMLSAFEYVDAQKAPPWDKKKIDSALSLLADLHFRSPLPDFLPHASSRNYVEKFLKADGGWLRIEAEKKIRDKFTGIFVEGEKWLQTALPVFVAAQKQAPRIGGAVGLLHQDLRADNFLFAEKTYLVDWPNVCMGPVVLDLAAFLPVLAVETNEAADSLLARYEAFAGSKVDRTALGVALASLSGHMADQAYRAVPEKLPRLRWMQKKALYGMLHWAAALLGVPEPKSFT